MDIRLAFASGWVCSLFVCYGMVRYGLVQYGFRDPDQGSVEIICGQRRAIFL